MRKCTEHKTKQKRRCDIKINIAEKRKVDTAYHKKKMWEGCAAGFVIEDALRGNDRKPTDIICFLSTVSSILLLSLDIEKKKRKTVSRARKHFERETKK
jgi:hypothetical protein